MKQTFGNRVETKSRLWDATRGRMGPSRKGGDKNASSYLLFQLVRRDHGGLPDAPRFGRGVTKKTLHVAAGSLIRRPHLVFQEKPLKKLKFFLLFGKNCDTLSGHLKCKSLRLVTGKAAAFTAVSTRPSLSAWEHFLKGGNTHDS